MYRTIQTDIWGDPWFVDLPPERKLLFIHLFTNRNVTACGSMQLSTSQIAFETKLSVKKVERELEALGDKILWLPAHNLIIVRNFYRHQRSKSSENFTVAAKKVIATLPEEGRAWLGDVYPELKEGMDTPKDTHTQPIPNPYPTQGDKEEVTVTATVEVTETGTEAVVTPPTPSRGKRKPILTDLPPDFVVTDRMREWAKERHHLSDAEIDGKTEDFLLYVKGHGKQYADWVAAWQNSMKWDRRGSPQPLRPQLPDGVTWDRVAELRNRIRGGYPVSDDDRRMVEQIDGKAAA